MATNSKSLEVTMYRLKRENPEQYKFITSFETFEDYCLYVQDLKEDLRLIKTYLSMNRLVKEACEQLDISRSSLYRFIKPEKKTKEIVEYPLLVKLMKLRTSYSGIICKK